MLRALLILLVPPVAVTAPAGTHPTLLIRPEDVAHLRHACGIDAPPAASEARTRFGLHAGAFDALRRRAAVAHASLALPGEAVAAAFCLLLDPDDPAAASWTSLIEGELKRPILATTDVVELMLAIDWAWDALSDELRADFVRKLRDRAEPLSPSDSPLDHLTFRRKLGSLALAAAVDQTDEPGPAWTAQRSRLMAAAKQYVRETLPAFVAWRGLSPTSPATAAAEESDTALLLELAAVLTGDDLWSQHRATVGRWLEHYLFALMSHPALQHHFIRDDGTEAPLLPCPSWDALFPLTAHLIAVRTRDPAAAAIADRVEAAMAGTGREAQPWAWVPVLFDTRGIPRADRSKLPPARNLGGAVVFRGGGPLFETAVWVEACQPYLRRGQSFDAGHFIFHAGGHLTVGAGDDIMLEATPGKNGGQWLGGQREPFDFGQFAAASIAHNCLLVFDPTDVLRWYGRRYEPGGGQRLIENTCTDFSLDRPAGRRGDRAGELSAGERSTGSIIGYGYDRQVAYAALDLQAAYPGRTLRRYTREFLFIRGDPGPTSGLSGVTALLVVDRVQTAGAVGVPVAVINLPSRPRVDGSDLAGEARMAGLENDAGIWSYENPRVVEWTERDGGMCCTMLLPEPRRLFVAGGPARREVIPQGPSAGRTYVAGGPDGFERLVIPAGRPNPQNAWYRLGAPTLLGEGFARAPIWGRIEIQPAQRAREHVFAMLLLAAPADPSAALRTGRLRCPQVSVERAQDRIDIHVRLDDDAVRISLPDGASVGGKVELSGSVTDTFELPTRVFPDPHLPTTAEADR